MTRNDRSTALTYGAAIALVSGGYSLLSGIAGIEVRAGMGGPRMAIATSEWITILLGVVVLVHGVALLTPLASRLGNASGPSMIGYSVIMLSNQALLAGLLDGTALIGGAMGPSVGDSTMGPEAIPGMGPDAGMAALALLMLISGALVTRSDVSM
jgi:hypothetical protein